MSGQEIGTVVGGIVGAYFGQPQLGMAIGGLIGGAIDPTKIKGPHIGQGQQQTSTDGVPIAWVIGTAKVAGTLCAVGPRYEVKVESGGKGGGPVQESYEAHQSFAILVCESSEIRNSTINSILMVEQDGKIVYDMRGGSNFADASGKWKTNVDFLFGGEDQLPHPKLEAIFGVGKTPAYRDRCLVVFKDFNLTPFGDRIPSFLFTVTSAVEDPYSHDGTAQYPSIIELPIADTPGPYSLVFATGGDPDKFQVFDGSTLLLDTGYYGAQELQATLNANLAAHGDPPETMHEYAWGRAGQPGYPSLDDQWNGFRDNRTFTKASRNTSLTVKVWSPGSASAWRVMFGGSVVGTVSAQTVIRRICNRGGVVDDAVDASALSSFPIIGYPIATQCSAADAMLPVLQAIFAFGTQVDGILLFKFYGEDVLVSVNDNDAVINDASDGAIQKTKRNQATEFPQKIVGQYIVPAQNYNTVAQQAERLAQTVVATGESDIQIPLAITATQAKQAVDKALKVAYATLEGTLDISVPYATDSANYLSLVAGEPLFQGNKRWVTDEVDIGINYLKISGRYDRQSAYTSNVQPITGNTPTPPTSMYSGPTDLMVMNLPSLRSQDTYGVYAAVKGEDASWRGATIQISYDGQQSWQNAATATIESVMGIVVSDVASSSSSDEADTIVNVGDDEMSSVTDAQLEANANAFAIVDASNVAEIRQAKYATLQDVSSSSSDGENRYLLTHQNTGLLGTDFVLHEAGEKFTLLNGVYFLPIDLSFKGKTLYFRAIGFGEVAEDQPIIELVYDPDTTIIIDGGEITS